MPTMVQSTGSFSVSGVSRALDPWTISTSSPWPAPTASTTTKVRPVPARRSRPVGSTRSGSTVSSLRPVSASTLAVAPTLPVNRARDIVASLARRPQRLRLPGDDQLLVRRHDPQLHPAARQVQRRLALRRLVGVGVQPDAEPLQVGTDGGADGGRVLADAAGEHDRLGPPQEQEV